MVKKDWKEQLGIVYSTNPSFGKNDGEETVRETVEARKQLLRVELDKRNGKPATLVTDFQGSDDELKELAKTLKVKCGAGGSSRDGEILVQGDFRIKIASLLEEMGYKVKRINFK
ncbi:MAG: translation initiation factor [Prevotellaceae bacterium]|jgi:translation initiation factor 1|nr:translation initiation factor [Prevotellaceae bacterium]